MSANQSTVTFKPVPGFRTYRVGDDGSIWSNLKRTALRGRAGRLVGTRSRPGRVWKRLRPKIDTAGRPTIALRKAGRYHHMRVCRLVLLAFVGPCPAGREACHNDGDPANNVPSNLRWDTHRANLADRTEHGTACVGERHGRAKLTEKQVLAVRADGAAGMSYRELSRKYRVHKSTVCHVVTRRVWRHV